VKSCERFYGNLRVIMIPGAGVGIVTTRICEFILNYRSGRTEKGTEDSDSEIELINRIYTENGGTVPRRLELWKILARFFEKKNPRF
jgi:hypothetical protein